MNVHRNVQSEMNDHEGMLEYWRSLVEMEKECIFNMYEKTKVTGLLFCMEANENEVGVVQLTTPLGVYPQARLRSLDILYIEMEMDLKNLQILLK